MGEGAGAGVEGRGGGGEEKGGGGEKKKDVYQFARPLLSTHHVPGARLGEALQRLQHGALTAATATGAHQSDRLSRLDPQRQPPRHDDRRPTRVGDIDVSQLQRARGTEREIDRNTVNTALTC